MATAVTADTYPQQIHAARTHLQACFKRAHDLFFVRENNLLRELEQIQTNYEKEINSYQEELQGLEVSKQALRDNLRDNDALNKALALLNDKRDDILKLSSATRSIRFQWNPDFTRFIQHAGEIISTVSQFNMAHDNPVSQFNLTHDIPVSRNYLMPDNTSPQSNVIPVIHIPQPILTPDINSTPDKIASQFNLTHIIPNTQSNLPPDIPGSQYYLIPDNAVPQSKVTPIIHIPQPILIPDIPVLRYNLTPDNTDAPQSNISPFFHASRSQPNLTPVNASLQYNLASLEPVSKSNLISDILNLKSTISSPENSLTLALNPEFTLTPIIPDYSNKSRSVISCCKQGGAPGKLDSPRGLDIEPQSGRIYIADYGNNRVQVFTSNGEYWFQFSHKMNKPWGICINNNTVYVTQHYGHCINLYKLDGTYLTKVGCKGNSKGQFNFPLGITVSEYSGYLYVCDYNNNRLQMFNKSHKFTSMFDRRNPKDVKLNCIAKLVIVLDESDPCIHLFNTTNHTLLKSIISYGAADKQIGNSQFFNIDYNCNIILTDNNKNCIKVFSKTGEFIAQIGREGNISEPKGVAINSQNRIVVVSNTANYAIQLF